MSDTESNLNSSDEELLRLQKEIDEEAAKALSQSIKRAKPANKTNPKKHSQSREGSRPTTSKSSTTISSSESSSSFDDFELALASNKPQEIAQKRLVQLDASLRECLKELIAILLEKLEMEILQGKHRAAW